MKTLLNKILRAVCECDEEFNAIQSDLSRYNAGLSAILFVIIFFRLGAERLLRAVFFALVGAVVLLISPAYRRVSHWLYLYASYRDRARYNRRMRQIDEPRERYRKIKASLADLARVAREAEANGTIDPQEVAHLECLVQRGSADLARLYRSSISNAEQKVEAAYAIDRAATELLYA